MGFLWWLTELLARKEPSACMWSAKGDVLICRDAQQHRQLTWFTGRGRLVVSQSARILLTLFSRWASEDSEEKTQTSEPGARRPTYEMRNASCRTLRESPDKKFVFYHKFPPLNYSCAAIIFYILFDSRESVGVKTVLWSWGNVGRRLRRRVKKLAVARPALIARSHCLTIARYSSFFFLSLSENRQIIQSDSRLACDIWLVPHSDSALHRCARLVDGINPRKQTKAGLQRYWSCFLIVV